MSENEKKRNEEKIVRTNQQRTSHLTLKSSFRPGERGFDGAR